MVTTRTIRDPVRWAIFAWFCDNGYTPLVESELDDLIATIDKAKNEKQHQPTEIQLTVP